MSCVKLAVWSIVAQKGTDTLIFYIFEYVAEGSRTIASEENYPPDDCRVIVSQTVAPEDNCPRGKLPPRQMSPRIIVP